MGIVYCHVPIRKQNGKWMGNDAFNRILLLLMKKAGYWKNECYYCKDYYKAIYFPVVKRYLHIGQFRPSYQQISKLNYVKNKIPNATSAYLLALFEIIENYIDDNDVHQTINTIRYGNKAFCQCFLRGLPFYIHFSENAQKTDQELYPGLDTLLKTLNDVDVICTNRGWYH